MSISLERHASPSPASAPAAVLPVRRDWYHRITQFHEEDAVVAWWHARTRPLGEWLTPARRRQVLSLGSVGAGVAYPLKMLRDRSPALPGISTSAVLIGAAVLFAFLYGVWRAAAAFPRLPAPIRRRPQTALHLAFWIAVAACWGAPTGPVRNVLAVVVVLLPFLIWRCGYLVLSGQRGRVAGSRFIDHLWYLYPVWGGTNVPFGKGPDYLARHEATSSLAFARSQLAGLKLLALSLLWAGVSVAMRGLVFGDAANPLTRAFGHHALDAPRLADLLDGKSRTSVPLAWASVYSQLVMDTLKITVNGHAFIGVLRLLGFHVFRNTYKPMLAESIVEFWNRQYFYFKELMVEFFFLPTFARRFRGRPALRMAAAVFAAACFGNVYYHVLKTEVALVHADPGAVWTALQARVFYGFILAIAITASMRREQRRRAAQDTQSPARRMLRIATVLTLLALMRVWAIDEASAGIVQRAVFVRGLFGL